MNSPLLLCAILLALLPLLSPSSLTAQQFATIDGGQRIVVYEDGSWAKVGEAKPGIELPKCTRTILSSQIIGDELHLTILDNEKEIKQVEKIAVLSSREEKISGFVNGSDKRWRDPHAVTVSKTTLQIGTELFSLMQIQNPLRQEFYEGKDRQAYRSSTEISLFEGFYCTSTREVQARSYQYRNGDEGKIFEDTSKEGSYGIEEAKILAANIYREILAIRLMD